MNIENVLKRIRGLRALASTALLPTPAERRTPAAEGSRVNGWRLAAVAHE